MPAKNTGKEDIRKDGISIWFYWGLDALMTYFFGYMKFTRRHRKAGTQWHTYLPSAHADRIQGKTVGFIVPDNKG